MKEERHLRNKAPFQHLGQNLCIIKIQSVWLLIILYAAGEKCILVNRKFQNCFHIPVFKDD